MQAKGNNPRKEEFPDFWFVGYKGRPDTISVHTMDRMSFLRESELDRLEAEAMLPDASVPERYKVDPTAGAVDKVKPSIWKRRRKVPKRYNFSIAALADKHVDKFRSGLKTTYENNATDTFVYRHNEVHRMQKEHKKQGGGGQKL